MTITGAHLKKQAGCDLVATTVRPFRFWQYHICIRGECSIVVRR